MVFLLGVIPPPTALARALHCLRQILWFHEDGDIFFLITPLVWMGIFFFFCKKSMVSKMPVFVWTGTEYTWKLIEAIFVHWLPSKSR